MPSIRCYNCNFLNFDTEAICKRCKAPMGEYAEAGMPSMPNAYADSGASAMPNLYGGGNMASYQMVQTAPPQRAAAPPRRQTSSYGAPPPPNYYDDLRGAHPSVQMRHDYSRTVTIEVPPVCVKCGNDHGLEMRKFKKDYTPPAAYLGFFLGGLLPMIIVVLICRKVHKMSGLFCTPCWNRYRPAKTVETLTAVAALGMIFVALIVAIGANAPIVGGLLFMAAMAVAIWGLYYARNTAPKYVNTNRKQIYISIPDYGEVEFTNSGVR